MGNLGWTEMFFIAVVALMIFGPKRLPEMGRKLGRIMGQLRQASDQFKQVWDSEVEKANLKDIQKQVQKDFSPNSLFDTTPSKIADATNLDPLAETPSQINSVDSINPTSINAPIDNTDNSATTSTPASQVAQAEELINPPLVAPIERSKLSFDLPISTSAEVSEVVAQVEEKQPISLSKY